jgi:hypothetical protein
VFSSELSENICLCKRHNILIHLKVFNQGVSRPFQMLHFNSILCEKKTVPSGNLNEQQFC